MALLDDSSIFSEERVGMKEDNKAAEFYDHVPVNGSKELRQNDIVIA